MAGPGRRNQDPDALLVQPWQEILPSIYQMLTISRSSNWITYLLIYLVAAIGLVNTQRMSALERKREFGVLMAIGMRPRKMFRMILTESLVLGTLGGLIGTALGLGGGLVPRHGRPGSGHVHGQGGVHRHGRGLHREDLRHPHPGGGPPAHPGHGVRGLPGRPLAGGEIRQAGSGSHHRREAMMLWRIAWRNLWRHRTRTLTMTSAVAFSYGLCLFSMGLGDDGHQQMLDEAAEGAGGDILVHADGYWESKSSDLVIGEAERCWPRLSLHRGSGPPSPG